MPGYSPHIFNIVNIIALSFWENLQYNMVLFSYNSVPLPVVT